MQVVVEGDSRPNLQMLQEVLGEAYGIPAKRVVAMKYRPLKREWVRLVQNVSRLAACPRRGEVGEYHGGDVEVDECWLAPLDRWVLSRRCRGAGMVPSKTGAG